MPKITDLTGRRFGHQIVLRFARVVPGENGNRDKFYWRVRCDCGGERDVIGASMISGKARMCRACSYRSRPPDPKRCTPVYQVWANMIQRCTNPNNIGWRNYGGRGIKVCRRWRSFDAFWQDMETGYAKGLTIERLNNDGDYEPGNCRWATMKEQAYNRRNNRYVDTPWGRTTLTEAAQRLGVNYMTLLYRMTHMSDPSLIFRSGKVPPRGRYSKGAAHAKEV